MPAKTWSKLQSQARTDASPSKNNETPLEDERCSDQTPSEEMIQIWESIGNIEGFRKKPHTLFNSFLPPFPRQTEDTHAHPNNDIADQNKKKKKGVDNPERPRPSSESPGLKCNGDG